MKDIIEVSHLCKNYGIISAIKDISFRVKKGSSFALLGKSNAGKSTIINILSTLMRQHKGEAYLNGYILGEDDANIRQSIGIVFARENLDALLSVEESLYIYGACHQMNQEQITKRIEKLIKLTKCTEFFRYPYRKLSKKEQRQADFTKALIHKPQILLLDEPTKNLEFRERAELWNILHQIKTQTGITILWTSCHGEEAERADRVALLHRGQIISKGTPNSLKNKYAKDQLKIHGPSNKLVKYLKHHQVPFRLNHSVLSISIQSSSNAEDVIELLTRIQGDIEDFEITQDSLEDILLQFARKENAHESSYH